MRGGRVSAARGEGLGGVQSSTLFPFVQRTTMIWVHTLAVPPALSCCTVPCFPLALPELITSSDISTSPSPRASTHAVNGRGGALRGPRRGSGDGGRAAGMTLGPCGLRARCAHARPRPGPGMAWRGRARPHRPNTVRPACTAPHKRDEDRAFYTRWQSGHVALAGAAADRGIRRRARCAEAVGQGRTSGRLSVPYHGAMAYRAYHAYRA